MQNANVGIQDKEAGGLILNCAKFDQVGGLSSRETLFEAGEMLFQNALRGHLALSTVMVRIDDFEHLVREYGYEAGVRALNVVGSTLKTRFRRSDLVAYYGHDIFCILAVNLAPEYLSNIGKECQRLVRQKQFPIRGEQLGCTISVGGLAQIADTFTHTIHKAKALLELSGRIAKNCTIIR